jgi:uncharacterized protein (DUF488 family)
MDHFPNLPRRHKVQVIADVRSHAYSRYASQFDREALMRALQEGGFQYVYLGAELGGRPQTEDELTAACPDGDQLV